MRSSLRISCSGRRRFAVALAAALLPLSGLAASAPESDPGQGAAHRTPAEMSAIAAATVAELKAAVDDVAKRFDEARSGKDAIRINCLAAKLTRLKGLLRIVEESVPRLNEAIAKNELSTAGFTATKIEIARDKGRELRSEAQGCLGQLAFATDQKTILDVEITGNMGIGDPTQLSSTLPAVVRPIAASPTL